jgi:hypothetical protein
MIGLPPIKSLNNAITSSTQKFVVVASQTFTRVNRLILVVNSLFLRRFLMNDEQALRSSLCFHSHVHMHFCDRERVKTKSTNARTLVTVNQTRRNVHMNEESVECTGHETVVSIALESFDRNDPLFDRV